MPLISILCPTMRVGGGIDILFHGLAQQSFKDFELVLSDALWDKRYDLIKSQAKELNLNVKHIKPGHCRFPVCSYCRYMNSALVHAAGEIALLIVDYTWLPPNLVEKHAQFHLSHTENDGLMGPHRYVTLPKLSSNYQPYSQDAVLQYADDVKLDKLDEVMFSIFDQSFNVDARTLSEDNSIGRDPKNNLFSGPIDGGMLHCKNESVRIKHLLDINGFDEDLDGTHGWQDTDIAERLTQKCQINWILDLEMVAQIVNPRPVFPLGVRERPYQSNEYVWRNKKNNNYTNLVNGWNLKKARENIINGKEWPGEMKLDKIKLNLASGTDLKEDWINLDIVANWPLNVGKAKSSCDIVWDARKDKIPFDNESVDEIYAGYLFLHLASSYHKPVMQEIYRVLKPGASLMVGEVEMDKVMFRYLENPEDNNACELIWGEQGSVHGESLANYDKHCHGFTEKSLYNFMSSFNFKNIKRIRIHDAAVWYELTLIGNK